MCFPDDSRGVGAPGEGVREVDSEVPDGGDDLHSCSIDVEGAGAGGGRPAKCVQDEVVVSAPLCQVFHFSPVCCLVTMGDESDHRCVVCKLNNKIVLVLSSAVEGHQCVQQWAQHTSLGRAGVQDDGG